MDKQCSSTYTVIVPWALNLVDLMWSRHSLIAQLHTSVLHRTLAVYCVNNIDAALIVSCSG